MRRKPERNLKSYAKRIRLVNPQYGTLNCYRLPHCGAYRSTARQHDAQTKKPCDGVKRKRKAARCLAGAAFPSDKAPVSLGSDRAPSISMSKTIRERSLTRTYCRSNERSEAWCKRKCPRLLKTANSRSFRLVAPSFRAFGRHFLWRQMKSLCLIPLNIEYWKTVRVVLGSPVGPRDSCPGRKRSANGTAGIDTGGIVLRKLRH